MRLPAPYHLYLKVMVLGRYLILGLLGFFLVSILAVIQRDHFGFFQACFCQCCAEHVERLVELLGEAR